MRPLKRGAPLPPLGPLWAPSDGDCSLLGASKGPGVGDPGGHAGNAGNARKLYAARAAVFGAARGANVRPQVPLPGTGGPWGSCVFRALCVDGQFCLLFSLFSLFYHNHACSSRILRHGEIAPHAHLRAPLTHAACPTDRRSKH